MHRIVYASRIPPRPLAGQRLEAAGQQLQAWKAPPESSWKRLGASKNSSEELFETPWMLSEPSWRLLDSLGGVLGALGVVLEVSWERAVPEASKRRLRAVLGALEAMLEPSGGQKDSKMKPKRAPHRAPEATRTENGEALIFDGCTQDFNDDSSLKAPFWSETWIQNRFQIAS